MRLEIDFLIFIYEISLSAEGREGSQELTVEGGVAGLSVRQLP